MSFTICKPYVEQKGSQNSQMPCQDRLLFSIKYKKLEILLSKCIKEQKAVCTGFLELELISGKYFRINSVFLKMQILCILIFDSIYFCQYTIRNRASLGAN